MYAFIIFLSRYRSRTKEVVQMFGFSASRSVRRPDNGANAKRSLRYGIENWTVAAMLKSSVASLVKVFSPLKKFIR